MQTQTIALPFTAPGQSLALTVHRFGTAGARPKVHIQAALHADEIPGMICAQHLRSQLAQLEAQGAIIGEVVLVPFANPVGLSQRLHGTAHGRFDFADGVNFNRDYPALADAVGAAVAGRLGKDAAANVATIRAALRAAIEAWPASTPASALKRQLMLLAHDADYVLDLHCDSEASVHLYTTDASAAAFEPLWRLLQARAVLLAPVSGGDPFDEATSRPWPELAQRLAGLPVPLACHATTVELRGRADVDDETAAADAAAIIGFLAVAGVVSGKTPPLPPALCQPTPLAGCEPVVAPCAGIIVFRQPVGATVKAGALIAELVDPATGARTELRAAGDGVLFARSAGRFAAAGQRIAKLAGNSMQRAGKLLSP